MNQEEYLEKAHEVLLKLLLEFDRVCKKYDVQYYLICGSLLGAVRHQDFIPWDDDVDVAMTRAAVSYTHLIGYSSFSKQFSTISDDFKIS